MESDYDRKSTPISGKNLPEDKVIIYINLRLKKSTWN
jgi:hypothetical protein